MSVKTIASRVAFVHRVAWVADRSVRTSTGLAPVVTGDAVLSRSVPCPKTVETAGTQLTKSRKPAAAVRDFSIIVTLILMLKMAARKSLS